MTIHIALLVSENLGIWTTAIERKSGAGRGGGKRINLYGIDRLRALILDLALRGKLVPQNGTDEPAKTLFDRICISDQRDLPNPRFEIPSSWTWVKFGQIAKFKPGRTPAREESRYWGGEHPWVSIADMEDGKTLTKTAESVSDLASELVFRGNLSPAGSILMSFKLTIGKIARLAMPSYHNEAIITVTPSIREIDPYLYLFLPICARTGVSRNAIKGATLNNASIFDIAIPLPPLAEQQRIVAKVDELMALCDALEAESTAVMAAHQALVQALLATLTASIDPDDLAANWTRLEAHFDTLFATEDSVDALKQTILNLAVRGKLVEWREEDEPASKVLARAVAAKNRIVADAKRQSNGEFEPSQSKYEAFSPSHWAWCFINDFGQVKGGKRIPKGKGFSKSKTNYIYLRVTDMEHGTINIENLVYINEDVHNDIAQYTINADDIYVTIAGTIGQVGRVPEILSGQHLTENAAKIVFSEIDQNFLLLLLNADDVQEQFARKTQAMAQPKLALKRIAGVRIPIPPLPEQRRIVAKVNELMALCDALKVRITDAATTQKRLADTIIERAAA